MKKRVLRGSGRILFLAMFVLSTVVQAAGVAGFLEQTQGMVMVKKSGAYERAQAGIALKVGDRVMTMGDAAAVIIQVGSCVTVLPENSVFTLRQPSVCAGGVDTIRQIGPFYAKAIGGETKRDVSPAKSKTPAKAKGTEAAAAAGVSSTAIYIGAGIAGMLALLAASSTTTHVP